MSEDIHDLKFVDGRLAALEEAVKWLVQYPGATGGADLREQIRREVEEREPGGGERFKRGFAHTLKAISE